MKSPFKFLDAYSIEDKDIFFGRDQEMEELYTLVFKSPLIVLYGLSGTGKTSLVQCGLSSKFDGPDWYPIFIRRQNNINKSFKSTIAANLGDQYQDDLIKDLIYLNRSSLRPLYLLFDQFEEIFILGSKEERNQFFATIAELLEAEIDCHIMLIMREEYLGQLYSYESILPTLFDFKFRIERMTSARVKSVIKESFDTFNITIDGNEEDILQQMVNNISDPKTGIALPYLQVYLDQLYKMVYAHTYTDDRGDSLPPISINNNDITKLGQIENVLDKFLSQQKIRIEKILEENNNNLPDNYVGKVLDAFATDEGTKRPLHYQRVDNLIHLKEVDQGLFPEGDHKLLTSCIELFEEARILRMDDDDIELAHDSLAALIDQSRSADQKRKNELKRRILNAHEEYKISGQFLNKKQLQLFDDCPGTLGLSAEVISFINDSQTHWVKVKEENKLKEKEAREYKQNKINLANERKIAKSKNLLIGAACIVVPILAFMAWRLNNKTNELKISQNVIRTQLDSSEIKRKSLKNINENFVGLQKTLEVLKYNPDLPRDSLRLLLGQIDSSFVVISKENKEIEVIKEKKTYAFSVHLEDKQGRKKTSFKLYEMIHLEVHLFLPYSIEKITYRWINPQGEVTRSKSISMGRNASPTRGKITDYRSAKIPGIGYKIEILDQDQVVIASAKYSITP